MNIFKKTIIFIFIISLQSTCMLASECEKIPLLQAEEIQHQISIKADDYPVLKEGFELCGRYNLQEFFDEKLQEFTSQNMKSDEESQGEHVFDALTHVIAPAQDLIVKKLSEDKILAGKFCRMLNQILDNNLDLYADSITTYFRRTTPHHITDKFFQYCVRVDFMKPILQKYILDDVVRIYSEIDYKTLRSQNMKMTESQFNSQIMAMDLKTNYSGEYSFYKKIVRNDNVQILHFFMNKGLIFSYQAMFNAARQFGANKIRSFLGDYPYGGNSLHVAIIMTSYDKIPTLITSGCNINKKDKKGNTPLHYLIRQLNEQKSNSYINYAKRSQQKAVSLLISSGANLSLENNEGKTPWDYAVNEEIRDLLKPQAAMQQQPVQFSVHNFMSLFCVAQSELAN